MRCQSASHSSGLLPKHAVSPRAATELTLFSKVYDLGAALKIGVIGKTAAPGQLPDEAVAGCFAPAQFFRPARSRNAPCRRRRWPQSTPQRDPIEIGYRVACQNAPRYASRKGRR